MESVDEILRLKPTLVIGSVPYKQETVGKLLDQAFNFLAMNPRTLASVYDDIQLLGGITALTPQAKRLIEKMKREFAAIEKRAREINQKLKVYCEAWPNPRISSPPWVAELVTICGGQMALPAGEKVSNEQVAQARPDVIVLAWAATGDRAKPEKSYQVKEWEDVPAIRKRRVYVVRDELLNTPGPPLIAGARELFRIFYGASASRGRK